MCAVSKQSGQQEAVCVWKKGGGDRFICGHFFLLTLNSLGKEQREREKSWADGWKEEQKEGKKAQMEGEMRSKAGREQWSHVRERCGEDAV